MAGSLKDIWTQEKRASGGIKLSVLNYRRLTHLVLSCGELLGIGKVVHGNGQEDIEKGVVTKQGEDNEVERVDHARPEKVTMRTMPW